MKGKALPKTFEGRMERLQAIVTGMEKSELPLEESVTLYREGMALSKVCREQLDKARHDITLYAEGLEKPFTPAAPDMSDTLLGAEDSAEEEDR